MHEAIRRTAERDACRQAFAGEILVSGVVRELVSGQRFAFHDLGEWPMKGLAQPVQVWSVRWAKGR